MSDTALRRARNHLARNDAEGDNAAIDALLAAWAEVAAPEIAELLDLTFLRLARESKELDPAIRFPRWPSDNVAFTMVTYKKRPHDVPALITVLEQRISSYLDQERVSVLLDYPFPDPRFALLARLYGAPPSYIAEQSYELIAKLIERSGDPRVIPYLARMALPRVNLSWMPNYPERIQQGARDLSIRLEELFRTRRRALDKEEGELVEEIRQSSLSETIRYERERRAMFESVVVPLKGEGDGDDAATDDGGIHVYADWLEEQSEPVAPYVMRKLAGETDITGPGTLETERWLGPLTFAVKVVDRRNGFPTYCRVVSTLEGTIGAVEWSTVERLDFARVVDPPKVVSEVILDPVMKSLRYLSLSLPCSEDLMRRAEEAQRSLRKITLEVVEQETPIPLSFINWLSARKTNDEAMLDCLIGVVASETARAAFELPLRRIEVVIEPPGYKVVLERDPTKGPWTKLSIEYPAYLNQNDMVESFRGIPDSALRKVDILMAPRKTGTIEARPLPLTRTHGSTLKARFPNAETSIRGY